MKTIKRTLGIVIKAVSIMGLAYALFGMFLYPTYFVDNICPRTEKTDYLFFCNADLNLEQCAGAKMDFCRTHANTTSLCVNVTIRDVWVGGYAATQIMKGNMSIDGFERHQYDHLVVEKYGIWEDKIPMFYNCDEGRFE